MNDVILPRERGQCKIASWRNHSGLTQVFATLSRQTFSSATVAARLCVSPHAFTASFQTSVTHSSLGRPLRLMYLSVAGRRLPGQKAALLIRLPSCARAALPKSNSCCFSSASVMGRWPEISSTRLLLTLERCDGLMPWIARRHRQWNPFRRLLSEVLSHAVAKA